MQFTELKIAEKLEGSRQSKELGRTCQVWGPGEPLRGEVSEAAGSACPERRDRSVGTLEMPA